MCGIIGCILKEKTDVGNIVINGLKNLEYRGYDSWGVAVVNDEIKVEKDVGKIGGITKLDLGKGKISIGHCLHKNTFIQLSDGSIKKISEIDSDSVLSLNFNGLKFTPKKCKWKRHKSPKNLYMIRTPSCLIRTTREHKMFVFSKGKIIKKKVHDISENDYLPVVKKINFNGKPRKLNKIKAKRYFKATKKIAEEIKKRLKEKKITQIKLVKEINISQGYLTHIFSFDRNIEEIRAKKIINYLKLDKKMFKPIDSIHGKYIKFPSKTNKKLIELVGYLLGDGYIAERTIRCKDTNKLLLLHYKKSIKKLFNISSKVVKLSDSNAFLLEANSKFLCDWLRKNFREITLKNESKKLPFFIGKLSNKELAALLRGLFDAESCVEMKSKQIKIVMKNETIIRTVQLLLFRFGILASFREFTTKWGLTYSLCLNDFNAFNNFLKFIGFNSIIKQKKTKLIFKNMKKILSFNNKIMPITINEFSSNYLNGQKIKKIKNPESLITEIIALRLIDSLSTQKNNSEAVRILKKYLNGDIFFQKIITKEKVESNYNFVYDLMVSGTENFIANGLISHNSRWATHGGVTQENAHPHLSQNKKIAVVHNGIIENFQELRKFLKDEGFNLVSDTDTEVIPQFIEYFMNKGNNFEKAFTDTISKIKGSYSIVAIHKDKNKMIAARNGSPLVLGISDNGLYVASDVIAFLKHTNKVIYLDDGEYAILGEDYHIFNNGREIKKKIKTIDWSVEEAKKGDYPHFMLKEISEQKFTIKQSIEQDPETIKKVTEQINDAFGVFFVGCGTSYHACVSASYIFSKVAKKHVNVVLASEFRNYEHFLTDKTLVIAVSQSGETADVLDAIKFAKKHNCKTLSIVNVMGSTLTRICDDNIMMNVGPEICVLSTKSYTSQLAILLLLAYSVAGKSGEGGKLIEEAVGHVNEIIDNNKKNLKKLAEKIKGSRDMFLIGRDLAYPSALEGALKIKEVSYIHAEGFAGAELKHGTIALIEDGVPCVVLATKDTEELILNNAMEIKSRGGYIIGIGEKDNKIYDYFIKVPLVGDADPILMIIPIQILSYYLALERGCDPDKPRNLAKSVTVK